MKKILNSWLLMLLLAALTIANTQAQTDEPAWQSRIDYLTPEGYADTSEVKNVSVVVDPAQCPNLAYIFIRIGTTEGAGDLLTLEVTFENGTVGDPGSINSQGWVVIPAGQFTIDPEAFFIETALYDPQHEPLNQ